MAITAPIFCVVGNEEEAGQFTKTLASMRISNPIRCIVGVNDAMSELDRCAQNGNAAPVLVFLSLAAQEANRLAAWFEAHPKERPSGLIAMTAFNDMRPIIQAYHLGVTAFLEWPLKTEDVRNAITTNASLNLRESGDQIEIGPTVGI
jgi:AmiR/NasT family two-component response regulator